MVEYGSSKYVPALWPYTLKLTHPDPQIPHGTLAVRARGQRASCDDPGLPHREVRLRQIPAHPTHPPFGPKPPGDGRVRGGRVRDGHGAGVGREPCRDRGAREGATTRAGHARAHDGAYRACQA